jgi:hypothetical protein
MRVARRDAVLLAGLLVFAAVSFGTGITWGLPSRAADPFLFGSRTPWTGAEVMALAGPWSPAGPRGSDRPQHAAGPATMPTVVNATDADRAEIVRRYRLYSEQPDEMITFRALSRMRPAAGDLDPRLYQYGGLWVYPVGAILRLAAAAHLVVLRTDLAFYLDHPDAFGRFYVVARLYSAAWGLAGVAVVFGLCRELTGRTLIAATAAGAYAAMPVVVNAAHEAKPHLAGTVLTLATVWAAARFVRTGRGWATAGVLAGAAAGMVLTGVAAWAVLPVMAIRRPRPLRTMVLAGLIATLTFVVTNPWLPYDAIAHRERLTSNVGNYGNFYRPSLAPAAVLHAGQLLVEGTSPVPVIVAVLGAALLPWRRWRSANGWLLAMPAAFVAAQFALLAAGKPAEYARFGLTLDVALAILAATSVTRLPMRPREARLAGVLVVAATALYGLRYDLNFLADGRRGGSRRATAAQLAAVSHVGRTLAIPADPAPYGLPPVDLFSWRIVVVPPGVSVPRGAVTVEPTDVVPSGLSSPISLANKPFRIVKSGGR